MFSALSKQVSRDKVESLASVIDTMKSVWNNIFLTFLRCSKFLYHLEGVPYGCEVTRHPYSLECKKTIWRQAGCFEEGILYPEKLSIAEMSHLDELNLV